MGCEKSDPRFIVMLFVDRILYVSDAGSVLVFELYIESTTVTLNVTFNIY